MDIRTRKTGNKHCITATEGKGANRVTVTATATDREVAASTALHGCYELVRKLRDIEKEDKDGS